uniref:Uncharacterized protein n=1 Tax=Arundo donax TaxID=35708 RepID=A0A0A9ABE5_ARUDO
MVSASVQYYQLILLSLNPGQHRTQLSDT